MNILYVCDIDGCISDASRRFEEAGPEPHRHDRDAYLQWLYKVQSESLILHDKPVPGMIDFCWALYKAGDFVYMTSREAKYRSVTHKWLNVHRFPPAPLYMRRDGSWEEAHDMKASRIEDLLLDMGNLIDQVVIVDDDPSGELAKVCRKKEWTMLKPTQGGY